MRIYVRLHIPNLSRGVRNLKAIRFGSTQKMHFCLYSLHGAMKIRKSISSMSSQCAYRSFQCCAYFSSLYLRHMHAPRTDTFVRVNEIILDFSSVRNAVRKIKETWMQHVKSRCWRYHRFRNNAIVHLNNS